MAWSQNARRLDRAHDIERLAINDGNAFVGAHIQELLSGVGGQRQIARKRRAGSDQLLHELAVVGEHLNAPVFPIGQIHRPIVGHADSMRDIEMRGSLGIRKGLWRDDRTAVLAARPLAEGEAYLRRVLSSYATYCNEVRTHLALRKETSTGRTAQRSGKSSPSRSCAVCITIMPG